MIPSIDKIRNVAIVAHIDHGKTTLIDSIFRATGTFRDNAKVEERVMDSNVLEKERGITIRSKHCSVHWNGYLINIIDTPGHADFSGEVERVLSMVDTVILLVDANEGPMPQTRYVLMRALRMGYRPIVVVNKVDRPNAEPSKALDKTFDLFLELGGSEAQCDFPVLYGSGLKGWIVDELDQQSDNLDALFQCIVDKVPPPEGDPEKPFLMQVSTIGWVDHIGRTGTGRILQGTIKKGETIQRITTTWTDVEVESDGLHHHGSHWKITGKSQEKVSYVWMTNGLTQELVDEVGAGEIVTVAGPKELDIGDTLSFLTEEKVARAPLDIEEPTVSMLFCINDGPFSGQEGQAVTIRQLRARLDKELRTNVALRVEDTGRSNGLKVSGRGELHLSILIEEMRREGMELCVSPPEIIAKRDETGALLEPIEELTIDVPLEYQGTVIEKLAKRKGELKNMHNEGRGMIRLEFRIPTRGLIGYRNDFLTDTRGLGILASRFVGYGPYVGAIESRGRGSLISMETGEVTSYSLENLQQRAALFVSPNERVYMGMVIGENSRPGDMPCNPTKKKAMTNHRAAGRDHSEGLDVPIKHTLDSAIEWIAPDELVEVTPKSVRVRKAILNAEDRKRDEKKKSAVG